MKPLIHPFINETDFWNEALKQTLKSIEEALKEHGHARIGLAGGATPKKLYEMLAERDLPWAKITWILLDERYVPANEEESNLRMIREALFVPAGVSPESQVFFDTEEPALKSAEEIDKKLHFLEKSRQPLFDFLILGAGKDGHIASIFEGAPSLFTNEYAYVAEASSSYETTERLTVSLSAMSSAKKALLLLKGSEKRTVIEALEGEPVLPLTALKYLASKVPVEVLAYLS